MDLPDSEGMEHDAGAASLKHCTRMLLARLPSHEEGRCLLTALGHCFLCVSANADTFRLHRACKDRCGVLGQRRDRHRAGWLQLLDGTFIAGRF